ncbi:MAG TPA: glutamyl-tRNA reductase [Desulfobacteraceae bacterium]|nr:glutamyl-tRNA reductase [Desulfobacteraceae bacterium]
MPRDVIVLLGVNHKTTPLEVREKMALSGGYEQPLKDLAAIGGLKEYYLLSTCNRVEVLYTTDRPAETRKEVLELLFGRAVPPKELDRYVYQYENEDAIQHLFMVASSLDSMIVGEAQILGQLKEAYRNAAEKNTSGLILNKLLHKAFFVAKRVRTETRIGASAVSISYAAVELARKIFGQLDNKSVMLVGAGEMAELAAEHLVGNGVTSVVVVNRTLERAVNLARRFNGRAASLEELVDQLQHVDIIISSTGATGTILSKKDLKPVMRERRNRPLFFIDIAVPRDLDQDINELDNVYLYDIDDLQNVVEMNRAERDREAVKAERIVEEETLKFSSWLDSMEVTPTIVELRRMADEICRVEVEKTLGKLKHFTPKEQKSLEKMASAIVSKMLHNPVQYLKADNADHSNQRHGRINTVREIFHLNENGGKETERNP